MAVLMTPPFMQFFDDDGNPLAEGKLYTYAAGTNTPKATYTTAAGNIENANPIELDAAGRCVAFILGSYKYTLTDANDVVIRTVDNVTSFNVTDNLSDAFFESLSGNGTQKVFALTQDLGTDENGVFVFVDNGMPNYVTNGDFASDTVWTKGAGWSIGAGVATATGAISTDISQTADQTLVQGQPYVATYTITRSAGSITPNIGGTAGTARSASGTYTEIIIAGSTQTIAFNTSGFTGTLDNVTVTPLMSIGRQILNPNQYTLDGDEIEFVVAPESGSNNILIFAPSLLVGAAASAAAEAQQFRDQTQVLRDETEVFHDNTEALYNQIISSDFVLYGTSVTSLTIGTGSKVFTTQAGKQWVLGQRLRAASGDGTMVMEGEVTDYTGTALTLDVDYTEGAGTHADWNIGVAGARGAQGAAGADGAGSGFKNTLINGSFAVNQRGVTSAADDIYHLDRWYALNQTAAQTVAQQTTQEDGQPYSLRMTQPQASAQRIGVAQIIEGRNCKHMRGGSVAFSARIRCSASQAIRYAILEWTGTEDAVTSDVVNDWTSGSFTAGGFFNSTTLAVVATGSVTPGAATWAEITGSGSVSASMNNLIVMVWSEGTLAQNATLDVGLAQLEVGTAKTAFEHRPYGVELDLCKRYLPVIRGSAGNNALGIFGHALSTTGLRLSTRLDVTPRANPTGITVSAASHFSAMVASSANALSALTFDSAQENVLNMTGTTTGLTAGGNNLLLASNASAVIYATGCEL